MIFYVIHDFGGHMIIQSDGGFNNGNTGGGCILFDVESVIYVYMERGLIVVVISEQYKLRDLVLIDIQ